MNDVRPHRVPIHWSTRSIRISGGTTGKQAMAIRNTLKGDDARIVSLPILSVESIEVIDDKKLATYNGKLQVKWHEEYKKDAQKNAQTSESETDVAQGISLMKGDRLLG